jgi:signal peptidase I
VRGFVRSLVWISAIAAAIGLLLWLFVFDVWTVPDDRPLAASIVPNLMPQDVILIRKGGTPAYGELARCVSPVTPGTFVIGRVFGTGGDPVEIVDNTITTAGKGLTARHACPPVTVAHPVTENLMTLSCGVADTGAWTFEFLSSNEATGSVYSTVVERGKLFLVSDDRVLHQDSRDFGAVDAASCEHVVYRLWGEHFSDSSRRFTLLW